MSGNNPGLSFGSRTTSRFLAKTPLSRIRPTRMPHVSQTDHGIAQPSPGKEVMRLDDGPGDVEWADLRSAVFWMRTRAVGLTATLMIVLELVWKAQFLSRLYFHSGDTLTVAMGDTANGFKIAINDVTRGRLQSDPAGPDHRDLRCPLDRRLDRVAVGDPAQVVHAVGVGAGHRQLARRGTGRQQQLGVTDGLTAGQADLLGAAVDAGHGLAQAELHVVLGVPVRGQGVQLLLA